MCGVVGFWVCPPLSLGEAKRLISCMADKLQHRGPDDSGIWLDEQAGLALGHRRLSIIDLSTAGRQPMHSSSGRFVISYNGEIYNFQELKADLTRLGRTFRTHTDTEVILEAIEQWGFEEALLRFVGMFAFALWDRAKRQLYLVRDRLGKKPMYFYANDGLVLFGSELKALCAHPKFPRTIDPSALALFLRYLYVPAPYAIYRATRKLQPGQYAVFPATSQGGPAKPTLQTYWDPLRIASDGSPPELDMSESEVLRQLEDLLRQAVSKRMIADVPLGALLSGGVDSSTVTALMQNLSARPVRTFTIGFHESDFNEAEYARGVARHLGTEHTELYVTPRETLEVIPKLPEIYDEPFADSSQIPTFVVSKLARRQVTVALSGDGGDELFGGYNRYFWAKRVWQAVGWAPVPLRRVFSSLLTSVAPERWDHLFKVLSPLAPKVLQQRLAGDKVHKLANILDSRDRDRVYQQLVSCWPQPEQLLSPQELQPADREVDPLLRLQEQLRMEDFVARMMLLDLKSYLPEDMLVKVDRASMAVSLEVRAPFLDQRVVEFVWRLPQHYKIRNGASKWLLRQILYQYVPRELIERPKSGFGIPIGQWLRGPLKCWAEELLAEKKLEQEGFFRSEVVARHWQEHQSGRRNWEYRLWALLMFQAWKERWRAQAPP